MSSECGLDHQRILQLRKKCSEMSLGSQAHCWNPKSNNLQAATRLGLNCPSWKVLPGNSDRWTHHLDLWFVSQHDSWIILRYKILFWGLCSHVAVQWGRHLQGGRSGHLLQRGYLVPFQMPTGHAGTPPAGWVSLRPVLHLPWGCLRCPWITPQMALALQAVEGNPWYHRCVGQPPEMWAHRCIMCWIHSDWSETSELLAELNKAGSSTSVPAPQGRSLFHIAPAAPSTGLWAFVGRPSPSLNCPDISQESIKPASAPHLERENRGEALFEMEMAHMLAILPAVSCTLLKAQVMFIPGLFTGATIWIETGTRAQETLPRGSPRAVRHLLSLTMSCHWQNVEFLYCFQCKPFKTFIWDSQTSPAGVSKPPSFSNTVWQTCPRTREGNWGETQEQSVTAATCSLGHLQQLSVAKTIYSCNFWMLSEKSLSRKKLMSV